MSLRNAFQYLRSSPALGTILGVIALGVAASVLYDMVVKPGLSVAGRHCLTLITFGSTGIRDAAYSAAALDPTPVTALQLLCALMFIPIGMTLARCIRLKLPGPASLAKVQQQLQDLEADASSANLVQIESIRARLEIVRKRASRFRAFLTVYASSALLILLVWFSVHNQSILVWRVFHAQMAIVRPHISMERRIQLLGKFAAVRTRSDYREIDKELHTIERQYKLRFPDVELW